MDAHDAANAPDGPKRDAAVDSDGSAGPSAAISDCRFLGLILLVAFSCSTCLIGIRSGPALGDHEAINALAARDAIETGRYLIPHVSDVPWIRKTPLGIWLIAATAFISGDELNSRPVSEFSARLPSALAGITTALIVCWLGTMLFGHRGGLIAGFIGAGCAGTVFFAHNAQVEMVLTMLCTLTLALFWRGAMCATPHRGYLAAFYAVFATSMMAKAPLPLAVVGLSLFVFWFVTVPLLESTNRVPYIPANPTRRLYTSFVDQIRKLKLIWLFPGVLVFLVVAGAWPLYVYLNVENALDLWRIEYLARFTGDLSDKVHPAWYYIPIALGLTFPFLASLPEAVIGLFLPRYARNRRGAAFALTIALVTTAFLSTAAFKRPHYLAAALPAYCLLLAPVIERLFFGPVFASARTVRVACVSIVLILISLAVGGSVYAQREFAELVRPGLIAIGGSIILWCMASAAFAVGRRASAFALLLLGVPVLIVMGGPLSHRIMRNASPSARALAREFVARGIGPGDDILWADSRPNATIEFYSGLRVRRLVDEIEMSKLREGRNSVSSVVKNEIAERIAKRLSAPRPAYIVLSRKYYERLAQSGDISHSVLFRLDGLCDDPGDDLVVFTQPKAGNTPKGLPSGGSPPE